MEEPSKYTISPFLCFPPFRSLSFLFVFILRDSFIWDGKVDDLEEETAPRNQRRGLLLMRAQVQNYRGLVRLKYKVEHCGDLLRRRIAWEGCEEMGGYFDEGREELRNEFRKNVGLLTEAEENPK